MVLRLKTRESRSSPGLPSRVNSGNSEARVQRDLLNKRSHITSTRIGLTYGESKNAAWASRPAAFFCFAMITKKTARRVFAFLTEVNRLQCHLHVRGLSFLLLPPMHTIWRPHACAPSTRSPLFTVPAGQIEKLALAAFFGHRAALCANAMLDPPVKTANTAVINSARLMKKSPVPECSFLSPAALRWFKLNVGASRAQSPGPAPPSPRLGQKIPIVGRQVRKDYGRRSATPTLTVRAADFASAQLMFSPSRSRLRSR